MTPFTIDPLSTDDHAWARAFIQNTWGAVWQVTRGVLHNVLDHPGFVARDNGLPCALVTYRIEGNQCEILILHSAAEGRGIGSALVEHVAEQARRAGCQRLWLITTNDNIHAIRWYQRRGFTIAAVHVDALAESRKLKPQIPLLGNEGIPLRDEIEFERWLI